MKINRLLLKVLDNWTELLLRIQGRVLMPYIWISKRHSIKCRTSVFSTKWMAMVLKDKCMTGFLRFSETDNTE